MTGKRVLVVEDEFIIADEIGSILSDAGYGVIGPVGSVEAAEVALDRPPRPDFAILDANLRGGSSAPIARRLRSMGVPFCVCTGYRFGDLMPTFGEVALIQKPVDGRALVALVRAALVPGKDPAGGA